MRLRRSSALAVSVMLLGVTTRSATAQSPAPPQQPTRVDSSTPNPRAVQPERPTVATHAGNVAPGYVEIETGVERDRIDATVRATQVPTVIKIGIAPRTQLSFNVPLSGGTGVPFGAGDVAVGLKLRVLEDAPVLADFALQPQLKFNTGGDRGTGTTDVSLLLISSRTLGPVAVDLNAGITRRSGDGILVPRTSSLWAAAGAAPIAGALSFAFELFGYPGTSGDAGNAPTVAVLFGPTYLVRPELNLDVGVILPVSGGQPRAVYAGLVANLGRLPFVR